MSHSNRITEEFESFIKGIAYNPQSNEMYFNGKLLTSKQRDEIFKLIAKEINDQKKL